jgi:hypothetical protein
MKVKVNEASGPVLDWMVSTCQNINPRYDMESHGSIWRGWWVATPKYERMPSYSTDPSQAYPIIHSEGISVIRCDDDYEVDAKGFCTNIRIPVWFAEHGGQHSLQTQYEGESYPPQFEISESDGFYGLTPLIAAMRCYVASKLGKEVEVPGELV